MKVLSEDKRSMKYGSVFAIQDSLSKFFLTQPIDTLCLFDESCTQNYLNSFDNWIKSTKNNSIIDLDKFGYKCFSHGSAQSFDKFYLNNPLKRFRCFRGEYLYHQLAWRDRYNWQYLEDDKLKNGDAVVISLPFADTGNKHINYDSLMQQCCDLNIPVLVDCAYFGVCSNIAFDFSFECITDITFSLSKTFPISHARAGIRYTKQDTDDTLFVYQKIDYVNRLSESIALRFLNNISSDYISSKYKNQQIELCKNLGIEPSNTVMIGIDTKNLFPEYNRGGTTNRLSLDRLFKE